MNRRERLMATIEGKPVDRPAVSFYELTGLDEDTTNPDPYNIYFDPSWRPLIELSRDRTDRIGRRGVPFLNTPPDPLEELTTVEIHEENGSRYTTRTIRAGKRTLTSCSRVDRDVNTSWEVEHLLKDTDDAKAWLDLPHAEFGGEPDTSGVLEAEAILGDTGICLIDIADPLCHAASLFSMADYTVLALTEPQLFRQMLDRFAAIILPRTEAIARALPGRLWRIVGSEYASPPYLPPRLYREYFSPYDTAMVQAVHRHGGYARIHSHGNLSAILDDIAATGCMGLDPIEPPPQGDVELRYVREKYGEQLVLFGNLEASDIEMLPTPQFEKKVCRAIAEGTAGSGRGFVLMPSACPYGRKLSELALKNYQKIIEVIDEL